MNIAIGDIHGKDCWKDLLNQDFDQAYFVGDYFDNYDQTPAVTQIRNFKEICEVARKDSRIHLCFGNHCHALGTEILTSSGWMPIEEAFLLAEKNNLNLAQFDINTLEISYAIPSYAFKGFSEKMKHITSRNIDMLVTEGHDLIYKNKKISVKELEKLKLIKETDFPLSCCSNDNVCIEDNWIKLLTWTIMDGTLVQDKKCINKKRIQFHLAKERKINDLINLLNEMNLSFTLRYGKKQENKLQDVFICINGELARQIFIKLNNKKQIPFEWIYFSNRQFNIFLSVLEKTDGHLRKEMVNCKSIMWGTINKNDCDIVSQMCLKNNYIFKYRLNNNSSGFVNGKPLYDCKIQENKVTRNDFVKINTIDYNNDTYCFTMPKGTLITRYNGKISLAGNCYHYMRGVDEQYSGFQRYSKFDIQEAIESNIDLLNLIYIVDNTIISHAGVTKTWLNMINKPLDQVNNAFRENRDICIFDGYNCYGDDITQSPIWVRPKSLLSDSIEGYNQIVGHTRVSDITTIENITLIDCLDSIVKCYKF